MTMLASDVARMKDGTRFPFEVYEDYQLLLRVVCGLESQRKQTQEDIESLEHMRNAALADPKAFVESLVDTPPPFPQRQRVIEVPEIDFKKYEEVKLGPDGLVNPVAVWSSTLQSHKYTFTNMPTVGDEKAPSTATYTSTSGVVLNKPVKLSNMVLQDPSLKVVRGRLADETKPESFNLTWTPEEHARLVELLDAYPEEEIAAQRWEKISKALGNRTPKQVASRTQKYFIKLAKAGLPVPGRMPNLAVYAKPQIKKKRRFERPYGKSSFCTPTVYMSDEEEGELSDVGSELRDSSEYKELLRLKKLRERKRREQVVSGEAVHQGYKCDSCQMEPIVGVRWSCTQCLDYNSVDLCMKCHDDEWTNELHRRDHVMERYAQPEQPYYMDDDYGFENIHGDYNYLDPNFRPRATH